MDSFEKYQKAEGDYFFISSGSSSSFSEGQEGDNRTTFFKQLSLEGNYN